MNKKKIIIPLTVLLIPALLAFLYFVIFPASPLGKVFFYISKVFIISFPVIWTLFGEKKKFPLPRFKQKGIRMGLISGIIIAMSAIILYIHVFYNTLPVAEVQQKAEQLGFGGSRFIFFALFVIIANSSIEEYYWRWFGYSKLKDVFSKKQSLLFSGIGFALHHIIILVMFFGWGAGLFFGFCVAVGGWLWCWFYDRYDSIWPSWVSHAIVDTGLMFIGFDMLFCR